MSTKNVVFFQGKTQYENTGDVLINKSLVQLLNRHASIILNDVGMPKWYVDSLLDNNVTKISELNTGFNKLLIISSIKSFFSNSQKIYLIAGPPGHLFGNDFNKSLRNILSGFLFMFLRLCGVKIIKIGFSIGPVGPKLAFSEWFRALPTNFYLVRESLSLELSKNIGIKKASFYPDLAWMYKTVPFTPNPIKNKIIISFRNSIFEGESSNEYLSKLKANLFKMLESVNSRYELIIIYQVERDYDFCKKLYIELKQTMNVSFVETQVSLENAPSIYNGALCVLTNRLHAALLGYKYAALPIIITDTKGHMKIKGIFMDAGIDDLILNIKDSEIDNYAKFDSIISRYDTIIDIIYNKEVYYNNLSDDVLNNIFK